MRSRAAAAAAVVVKVPELRSMMTAAVMTLPTTQNGSVRRAAAPSYSPPFSLPSLPSFLWWDLFRRSIRIASISHGAANFPHRAFHRSSREFAANGTRITLRRSTHLQNSLPSFEILENNAAGAAAPRPLQCSSDSHGVAGGRGDWRVCRRIDALEKSASGNNTLHDSTSPFF